MGRRTKVGLQGWRGVGSVGGGGGLVKDRMDTHSLSKGAGRLIFSQQRGISWQIRPPVGLPSLVCGAAVLPLRRLHSPEPSEGAVCLEGVTPLPAHRKLWALSTGHRLVRAVSRPPSRRGLSSPRRACTKGSLMPSFP